PQLEPQPPAAGPAGILPRAGGLARGGRVRPEPADQAPGQPPARRGPAVVRHAEAVRRPVRPRDGAGPQAAGARRAQGVLLRDHHRRPRHRGPGREEGRPGVCDGRDPGAPDGLPAQRGALGPGGAEAGRRALPRQARRLPVRLPHRGRDGGGPAAAGRPRAPERAAPPGRRGHHDPAELRPAGAAQGRAPRGLRAAGAPQPVLRRGGVRPGLGAGRRGLPLPRLRPGRRREAGGALRGARHGAQARPAAVHERLRAERVGRQARRERHRLAAEAGHAARGGAGHGAEEQQRQAGAVDGAGPAGRRRPDEAGLRLPQDPAPAPRARGAGHAVLQAGGLRGADHAQRAQHVGHHQDAGGDVPEPGRGQVRDHAGPAEAGGARVRRAPGHLRERVRGRGRRRRG
ncbi:unnamed protein product, partial [Heterosigma akashiwo]